MQKSIKVSLFITSDKKLQVKVMASEAAMTFTADSKADRKSAENTTFQHRSCACFRRSPHGVKIRLFMKIRGRKCRNVRKIGIFSGVVREKGVAVYFHPEKIMKSEQEYQEDNCASKTEFIEKAVKFYIGYLRQEEVNYLSPMITETVKAQIKGTEQRLARLLFKVTVELGKLFHMTAALNDVDDEILKSLHAMCVTEVRKINGIIDYEDAVDYQQN